MTGHQVITPATMKSRWLAMCNASDRCTVS